MIGSSDPSLGNSTSNVGAYSVGASKEGFASIFPGSLFFGLLELLERCIRLRHRWGRFWKPLTFLPLEPSNPPAF
ncbi:unnamed protein product [Prunus armeniaca]